jgi:membrane-anchored mycosin MYCP
VNGRTAASAVLAGALLLLGPTAVAAPRLRPLPATTVAPPAPPPLHADPPAGRRPGATPGLRVPATCTPPAADEPPSGDPGRERLQLDAVHALATGAGQTIAVIDTGVAPGDRFGPRLRGGGDYLTGGDGLDDCDGHGTAVAGLLAASPDLAGTAGRDGVVGIAPGAQLVAIRQSSPSFQVAGQDGAARGAGDVRTLAEAIVLAVRAGADVINISEAVCLPAAQGATQGASIQAALHFAAQSDVVVVAAAGNAGVGSCAAAGQEPPDQVSLPGWYGDDILTFGAVGPADAPAAFTVPGPWVDVAAPGTGLRSLAVGGGTTGTGVEGTSFAAPWVAGLAALVRQRFPALTAAQVTDRILATARRPPGGHSDALGYGVADPVRALTAVPEVLAPGPPAPAVTAALPGTAARAPVPPPSRSVDVVAVGALVVAGAAAAWLLRRRPAGPRS